MSFKFLKTKFKGMYFIEPHQFIDDRGIYTKYFETGIYSINEVPFQISEYSEILSYCGSLRGLHYQDEDSQGKLVTVSAGRVFDVAVDLRRNSATFGEFHSCFLDSSDPILLFIPEGFAHGFLSLKNDTRFCYHSSGSYLPNESKTIIWNDETLNIPWPVELCEKIILSEKDKRGITFLSYLNEKK